MADRYKFIGNQTLVYFRYMNMDNSETLVAEPGKDYLIRACDWELAVPPPDGRWESTPVRVSRKSKPLPPPAEPEPEPAAESLPADPADQEKGE